MSKFNRPAGEPGKSAKKLDSTLDRQRPHRQSCVSKSGRFQMSGIAAHGIAKENRFQKIAKIPRPDSENDGRGAAQSDSKTANTKPRTAL